MQGFGGGFGGGAMMGGGGMYKNALVIHVEKVTDFTQDYDRAEPRLPSIEARVCVENDGMGCFDYEKTATNATIPLCLQSGQPKRTEGKDLIYEHDFVYYLNMAYKDGETSFTCNFHGLHGSYLSYTSAPNGPFDLKIQKTGVPKTVEKFSSAYSGGTITWWATIYPPSEATGAPPAPKSNREQFNDKLSAYHAYVKEHNGEHPPQGHPMYCPPNQRARLGYQEDGTLADGPPGGGGGPAGGPAGGPGQGHPGGRGGFGGMMGRFGGGGGGGGGGGQAPPQQHQGQPPPQQQNQPPPQQQGGGGSGFGGMMGRFGGGAQAPPQQHQGQPPPQQQGGGGAGFGGMMGRMGGMMAGLQQQQPPPQQTQGHPAGYGQPAPQQHTTQPPPQQTHRW